MLRFSRVTYAKVCSPSQSLAFRDLLASSPSFQRYYGGVLMIKIENIGKVFNPHSRNRNEVLKGVSFELPENGLVAIYGKSGSGKTTLLNILGGLEKQDSGKICIDGKETVTGKPQEVHIYYKIDIGSIL